MKFDPSYIIGQEINGYLFLELIGKGGYSFVYLVKNVSNNYNFAAKIIPFNGEDHEQLKFFESEIESLSRLDHPNIIRFFDYFRFLNTMVLILEYCKNGSLQHVINQNNFLLVESFYFILTDLIGALLHMHNKKIAHGDIKPLNILFDSYHRPKICDFGLSVYYTKNDTLYRSCGSLAYLSPEIILKNNFNPFYSDIWSLGITFYQCLTGKVPFYGSNPKDILQDIYSTKITFPKHVPIPLRQLIIKMIEIKPQNRISLEEIYQFLSIRTIKLPFKYQITTKNPFLFLNNTNLKIKSLKPLNGIYKERYNTGFSPKPFYSSNSTIEH